MITLTRVNNPIDKTNRDIIKIDRAGWDFVVREMQDIPDESYNIYIDGHKKKITDPVNDDSFIAIISTVSGGDTGKQIGSILAMIVLVYYGVPFAAGALGITQGTAAYMALTMAVTVGGGYLVSSLMPVGTTSSNDISTTTSYSWNPQNTQQQGLPVPRIYGKNKTYGNVVACHTDTNGTEQTLNALICTGMGPIQGIVKDDNDIDQIFINDQLYTSFEDVVVETRRGLINQTHVSFFDQIKPEYQLNYVTPHGSPKTYLMPDSDYDDLEIVICFTRGLYYYNSSGTLTNNSVGVKIEIQEEDNGSTWHTLVDTTISDNTTSATYRKFVASETYSGGSSYTITRGSKYRVRLTKTSSDKTSSQYGDTMSLYSIREVLNDNFTYPRKSLIGISAMATDQLSGSLTISAIQQGLIVNVFDGTSWNLEYSNNPAWVLWDVLTQPVIDGDGDTTSYSIIRYEGIDPNRLVLSSFWELAQYCDDLVSDGAGGTEKRITFNGIFEEGMSMWEAALKIMTIARCIPVWQGINISLAINKTGILTGTFNDGNIVKETFKETFLDITDRVREIQATFNDSEADYDKTVFSVFDSASRNYYNKTSLDLFGCTKSTEAWRAAMLRLLENRYIISTVTFEVGIESLFCNIGDIVWIQNNNTSYEGNIGGRIISATTNTVTLDREPDPEKIINTIITRTYDESNQQDQIDEFDVLSISGSTVTIDGNWTVIPKQYDTYILGENEVLAKKYRVRGYRKASDQTMKLTCIEYSEAAMGFEDTDEPTIPMANYTEPGSSSSSIVQPPTLTEIRDTYPVDAVFAESSISTDIPLFDGFDYTDNSPSAGSVTTIAFGIYYQGDVYSVSSFSSSDAYFYWDPTYNSGTELQSTNSIDTVLANSGWIVGVNTSGTFYPSFGRRVIHAGILQTGTITTDKLSADSVTADKISVTSLSAISGNLGSITIGTAQIDNAAITNAKISNLSVTTGKIADSAATITQHSSSSGGTIGSNLSDSEKTLLTLSSFPSSGGAINITGAFVLTASSDVQKPQLRIYRGSTLIGSTIPMSDNLLSGDSLAFTLSTVDIPGSGNRTYYLKLYANYAKSTCTATTRRIYAEESKK